MFHCTSNSANMNSRSSIFSGAAFFLNPRKAIKVLNVENGNFTPLVLLTSGGMSKECKRFINRLANLQARRKGAQEYGDVVRVLRTKLRLALLKTTLIALRGHRKKASDKDFSLPLSEISYNLVPSPANS